jgi:general secretion pathway protein G
VNGKLENRLGCHCTARALGVRSPFTVHRSLITGFTLVELLVVLAIVALLLSIAVPRYFGSLDRSKETVLKENLFQVRESLDKYFSDTGSYPDRIEDLVTRHYLRSAPIDPVTGSTTTWVVVPPREADKGGVFDIRSGAAGNGKDGTAYRDW